MTLSSRLCLRRLQPHGTCHHITKYQPQFHSFITPYATCEKWTRIPGACCSPGQNSFASVSIMSPPGSIRSYSLYTPNQPDAKFHKLTSNHVSHFRNTFKNPDSQMILGPKWTEKDHSGKGNDSAVEKKSASGVHSNADEQDPLLKYNQDWMGQVRGHSNLVLRPKSTEELSQILRYCNQEYLPVNIQGGNTGLVMGSVPVFDEIIVSMELMNQIVEFNELSGSLVCEAGCVLESLSDFVEEKGFSFPLDLGSKGSCQIGGNLATCAGGLRFARFKSLHANLLGLEVVLADGTIMSDLKTIRKDNTGYHLNHLFLGSEGSLGVITKVALNCPAASSSVNVALLGLNGSFDQVTQVYKAARQELGEIVSAFEFFDSQSMDLVVKVQKSENPLDESFDFYLLIETRGSNSQHDQEKLDAFLEKVTEQNIVQNGTVASSAREMRDIWLIRESITLSLGESCTRGEKVYKYDLGIPLSQLYELVDIMRERLKGVATEVVGYGHAGDDNLHINIIGPDTEEFLSLLEPFIYEYISERGGSISAEHGIGRMKNHILNLSKSQSSIEYMRKMKHVFDPKGILAPYKVLPPSEQE